MSEPIYTHADITARYASMIHSFMADLDLAVQGDKPLSGLDDLIAENNAYLMKDIDLMGELDFGLRNGRLKIVEEEGASFAFPTQTVYLQREAQK